MIRYVPDYHGTAEATVLAAADAKVGELAANIADKARALALAVGDGDEMSDFIETLRVVEGVRPKGRGFRQVRADIEDRDGTPMDSASAKRRILGTAAGVVLFDGGS